MTTFKEFLNESEKFETMYDLEAFIQGKHSPETYKDSLEFFNKIPKLPDMLKNSKPFQGRFDTLMVNVDNDQYRIQIDYPRHLLKVYIISDSEKSQDTLIKQYPFQDLV